MEKNVAVTSDPPPEIPENCWNNLYAFSSVTILTTFLWLEIDAGDLYFQQSSTISHIVDEAITLLCKKF